MAGYVDLPSRANGIRPFKVEINIRQDFTGSLKCQPLKNDWYEMLKLNGWLSSQLFKEQFPAHFAETMKEIESKGDGKIEMEEGKEYLAKTPPLLKIMTLPYLKDITMAFPSFVLHTEAED
ncbi:calcineurin B protein [Trifolium repens]|nr:calcineurin B protein [Trifolium repens]